MKILCLIDHLGAGGAQRQMSYLARGMRARGHSVACAVVFAQFEFYRQFVENGGVDVIDLARVVRGGTLSGLAWLLRRHRFNVVVSFLRRPNIYAEIGGILVPETAIVVSERGSRHSDRSLLGAVLRHRLHGLADCVVTNSMAHSQWLRSRYPWLAESTVTIYNGVDTEWFQPSARKADARLRLLGIGRVSAEKNVLALVRALQLFAGRHGWSPEVGWAGRRAVETEVGRAYNREVDAVLAEDPRVANAWTWLGVRADVDRLLSNCDALILPSLHEGLPNVICEALAAGRPVLASDVSDNRILVEEGRRGFLFDPTVAESILDATERFLRLTPAEWTSMSVAARTFAEERLSVGRMVDEFESLFHRLTAERGFRQSVIRPS